MRGHADAMGQLWEAMVRRWGAAGSGVEAMRELWVAVEAPWGGCVWLRESYGEAMGNYE